MKTTTDTPLNYAHTLAAATFGIDPSTINFRGSTPEASLCRKLTKEFTSVEGSLPQGEKLTDEKIQAYLIEAARFQYNLLYDVPNEDHEKLYQSIKNRVKALGGDYSVLGNHMMINVSSDEMEADLEALRELHSVGLSDYKTLLSKQTGLPAEHINIDVRGTNDQGLGGITSFVDIVFKTKKFILENDTQAEPGHGIPILACQHLSSHTWTPIYQSRQSTLTVTRDGETTTYKKHFGSIKENIDLKKDDEISTGFAIKIADAPGRLATVLMNYVKEQRNSAV